MNVEIGAEAALFPEKEYISGISVAVHRMAGRYDNPIPESIVSPSQGLWIWLLEGLFHSWLQYPLVIQQRRLYSDLHAQKENILQLLIKGIYL